MTWNGLLQALADADVVFLGETHTDETTHRIELAVYEGLLERRKGDVVLALEMFERDVQDDLDAYLAGEIEEDEFLKRARPWNNYRTAYRPLIERAKTSGQVVVAANFPRAIGRRIAMEGPQALTNLAGDAKAHIPAKLFPNSAQYWKRVDNAVRGHGDMMRAATGDQARLYSTQSLWDNAMGDACAVALDKHPGHLVLHINGGFHTAYWDGTVAQLRQRRPPTAVKTVAVDPVTNPSVEQLKGSPIADYVILAESRANDLHDGSWSVSIQRELKYRFHLPEAASTETPVPLLIWLTEDGLNSIDGLDLWRSRLGDVAAIAVLDAPHREVQPDLSVGGRWFWPESFASDIDAAAVAVDRVWGYLLRHFPLDPAHVCLAGEGTGATVAATISMLTDSMDIRAVAWAPRQYAKTKDIPLPLPEFRGDQPAPRKSLIVVGGTNDEAWWASELKAYKEIGFESRLIAVTDDPWHRETQLENALRDGLGLVRRTTTAAGARRYILPESDSPRARHWARLHAIWAEGNAGQVAKLETSPPDAKAVRVPTTIRPQSFSAAGSLPQCPGPFGGTTVVVLSQETTDADRQAWFALEENDPIAKESRFHRLRVATDNGERSLPDLLTQLTLTNRKNVLIVPATFCADPLRMQTMERSVRGFQDRMTIKWLPGLGGQKAALHIDTK